jgi:hypothetical protein
MIILPNDELLIETGLPKGSMQHVERKVVDELLEKTNTLHQEISPEDQQPMPFTAWPGLGNPTAFIGKTGSDHLGKLFHNDMINSGISPQLISTTLKPEPPLHLSAPIQNAHLRCFWELRWNFRLPILTMNISKALMSSTSKATWFRTIN